MGRTSVDLRITLPEYPSKEMVLKVATQQYV